MRIKTRLKETPKNLWIFIALGLLFALVPVVSAHDFWIDQKGKEFLPGIELSEPRPGLAGGKGLTATGGNVLYLSPGFRFAFPKLQNANLGLLIKIPIFKNLNEQNQQQGSEGLEKYRMIGTLSFYF